MTETIHDRKSLGIFISSMLIFGTIGVFRRYIPLSSTLLACVRGILGGLFMLALAIIRKKWNSEKLPARTLLQLTAAGAMIGANWLLLFEAYNYTTVAAATLCYYMAPTIVVLLTPFFFHERLKGRKAACAAVSVTGMVLVSGAAEGIGGQGDHLRGILLGLGAALLYAGVMIMNKKIRGVGTYQRTVAELLSAGAVMLPFLPAGGGADIGKMTASAVILVIAVGVIHTGTAYAMYFGSIRRLGVQTIAVLSYIDPVSALLFSAFLLREPLSTLNIAGAMLIIGAAVISERTPE